MKRLPVVFGTTAQRDLDGVQRWIAEQSGSAEIAFGYGDRLVSRCERIGLAPRSGRSRDDLRRGARQVAFERSATIIYRVGADHVLILRILRRGRDVERALTP